MTPEQVELIAERVAKETVREVLLQLGIHTDSAIEMQRDMQYLRAWRRSMARMTDKGTLMLFTVAFAGIVAAVVSGIKDWLTR